MKKKLCFLLVWASSLALVFAQTHAAYGNNPQAGHYAPVNGIYLYYETYGSGETLLLLHGNGGSIEAFKNQIPFFEKHYNVIAVDSRIQGKSGGSVDTLSYEMMASDFAGLLDYLHVDSAYVLGWSDGGIDGLLLALNFPGKVKRLAVSGANIVPDTTALYAADLGNMRRIAQSPTSSPREKTLNRMMIDQPQIPYTELKKIHCPVLVMAGDRDMIKPEHTLKIYQSLSSASLCIFPDSYHHVCQQHPALFNETVLTFFKK
ncbi:MAG: alpha/beta hydrolase [Bacteroidota bacterium]|nr:alpha/beta hydrolase [Bacteroidota bacterium]